MTLHKDKKKPNFHEHGFEIKQKFIDKETVESIINEIAQSNEKHPDHGIRNADKKFGTINSLVNSDKLITLASTLLGSHPEIVRVIFFDKTPEKNWLVTWHQDKTIAVNKKKVIDNWGPWSIKDGIHHVQPPLDVLNQIITFRLHLDNTSKDNGCLKVIPSSHGLGKLSQKKIQEMIKLEEPYFCEAQSGDLLLIRPHILHSSNKSSKPSHRRVVHIEYSNYKLPEDLTWNTEGS